MYGSATRMVTVIVVRPNPKIKIVVKRPLVNGVTAFVVTVTKPVEMPDSVVPRLMKQLVPTGLRLMKTDVPCVQKKRRVQKINRFPVEVHVASLIINVLTENVVKMAFVANRRQLHARHLKNMGEIGDVVHKMKHVPDMRCVAGQEDVLSIKFLTVAVQNK